MNTTVVEQYFNKIVKHLETLEMKSMKHPESCRDDKGTD